MKFDSLLFLPFGFSLYFIGEYTSLLLFFPLFILSFFRSRLLYITLLLPGILLFLTEIFASSYYIIYFISLALFLFFSCRYRLFFLKEILLISLYLVLLYLSFYFAEEQLYELYLDSGIENKINSITLEVIVLLNILQITILYLLAIIKKKLGIVKCI
jgi:hypothetical protein